MEIAEVVRKYEEQVGYYTSNVQSLDIARNIVRDLQGSVSGKKLILYGAGSVGRGFIKLLHELEIPVAHVVAKNWREVGEHMGILIESPEILRCIDDPQGYILIAACNRKIMPEIVEDIRNLNNMFTQVQCGHDIHMLWQSAWCMVKAERDKKINIKDCYECSCLDNACNSLYRYLKMVNGYDDKTSKGTEKIKMIGYLLSNICTLKCKNCCESVPYIPKASKHFVPAEKVIKDIIKMSTACRFLTLLEFIGGEPFLHPELPYILAEVLKIKNVGVIHVFTNGTVVPDERLCDALRDERVIVYLSNYQVSYPKKFSGIVEQTVDRLEQYNVQYFWGKRQAWMDFSDYGLQCDDEELLMKKFPDCFLHNCNRLMDGKLYVCPHQYAGIQLGSLKEESVLDIHSYTNEQLADELEIFKDYPYIDACRYCSMPYDAPIVLSGEQL